MSLASSDAKKSATDAAARAISSMPTPAANSSRTPPPRTGLFQSGVIKDRRKCCATAVGERVATVLAVVHDESTDGHRLHYLCEDSDRRVVNPGSNAEQDYAVLCSELCRRLCHGLVPPHDFANATIACSRV